MFGKKLPDKLDDNKNDLKIHVEELIGKIRGIIIGKKKVEKVSLELIGMLLEIVLKELKYKPVYVMANKTGSF